MKRLLMLLWTMTFIFTVCKANEIDKTGSNMFRLFKNASPIDDFWNWFKGNEKRLKKFEENPDRCLNEVLAQVKKIQSGLAIEFEPPQNGVIFMTVSANGNRDIFSVVQSIVDKAPAIDGWKFIAFRQRMKLDQVKGMKLKAEGHELDPEKMKFFPIVNGETLDIIIYANGVNDENYNQIAYGGLLLLDNILGEFDCVTKVQSYDFHSMPTKKEELEGLLPLLEIANYVDKFHKSKKVN